MKKQTLCDGSVTKLILNRGSDSNLKPSTGANVSVHYTISVKEKQFFSTRDKNQPFTFKFDKCKVIKGFEVAICSMCKGERAIFSIDPNFAYKNKKNTKLQPPQPHGLDINSVVRFDIELLNWIDLVNVTSDGKVQALVHKIGRKVGRQPNAFASVTLKYTARIEGSRKPFLNYSKKKIQKSLGDLDDNEQTEGFVCGIRKLTKGSRVEIFVPFEYGYGKEGDVELGIPPCANLVYHVKLVCFKQGKKIKDMSNEQRFERANVLKDRGNTLFRGKEFIPRALCRALQMYEDAINCFPPKDTNVEPHERDKLGRFLVDCYCNQAACLLRERNYHETILKCNKALSFIPMHAKSLWRRAQAYTKSASYLEALQDLEKLSKIDGFFQLQPKAKELYRIVSNRSQKQKKKTKKYTKQQRKKLIVDKYKKMPGGELYNQKEMEEETKRQKKERKQAKLQHFGKLGITKVTSSDESESEGREPDPETLELKRIIDEEIEANKGKKRPPCPFTFKFKDEKKK